MLIVFGVLIGLLVIGLAGWFIVYAPRSSAPKLATTVSTRSIKVGSISRDFIVVVPDEVKPGAPLWVVLHGASSRAEHMRFITGYQFEELAAREGFVVVYPDGYKQTWNDCRTEAKYAARTEGIDDVAFLNKLIKQLVGQYELDSSRVHGFGYSNGAHMLYKMLAQSPHTFATIVANAANLPEPESSDCVGFSVPTPVMLVAGTKDPLNPYVGGSAGNRTNRLGEVRSAYASAEVFARANDVAGAKSNANINSVDGAPSRTLVAGNDGKRHSVVLQEFGAGSSTPVRLYTLKGGGHVVPNSGYRAPRIMGHSSHNFDAPIAAGEFAELLARNSK